MLQESVSLLDQFEVTASTHFVDFESRLASARRELTCARKHNLQRAFKLQTTATMSATSVSRVTISMLMPSLRELILSRITVVGDSFIKKVL